ncbi:MAG: hypothetical protein O6942_03745 [Bacteroidetes bacterium]|nr:hypothetical protein [Bacteroidota bacterium]
MQWSFDLPFLPTFEVWHSAVMSYPLLLLSQLGIIAALTKTALDFSTGRADASRQSGRLWLWFGLVYLGAMLARLILGLTVMSSHFWFSRHLPTTFHIVLASFVMLVGLFHWRKHGALRANVQDG